MHGGETETSHMMVSRPDLVHMDRAASQSGADQQRLADLPTSIYTGIWWYARFPEHYSGDPATANLDLGNFDMKTWTSQIATALRAIKEDKKALQLQNEFYDKAENPLRTNQ